MNQHGGGYVPGEMEMTSGHVSYFTFPSPTHFMVRSVAEMP